MTLTDAAAIATIAGPFVGLAQAGLILYGIRVMQSAGERRAREQDQRHVESMAALTELIRRTGGAR